MDEVGMPDKDIALTRNKNRLFQLLLTDGCLDPVLIIPIVFPAEPKAGRAFVEIFIQQVGKKVTAGIIKERAIIGTAVLKRDPDSDQVAKGIRGHMDTIRMGPLAAAPNKIDRLKRQDRFVQDKTEDGDKPLVVGDLPYDPGLAVREKQLVLMGGTELAPGHQPVRLPLDAIGLRGTKTTFHDQVAFV